MNRHKLSVSDKLAFEQALECKLTERESSSYKGVQLYEFDGRHLYVRIINMIRENSKSIYDTELESSYDDAYPLLSDKNAPRGITIIISPVKMTKKCGPFQWFISGPSHYCIEKARMAKQRLFAREEKDTNMLSNYKKMYHVHVAEPYDLESAIEDAKEFIEHYASENIVYVIYATPYDINQIKNKHIKIGNSKIKIECA